MGVHIGNTALKECYLGSTAISAIYLGGTKIWPTGPAMLLDFYQPAGALADDAIVAGPSTTTFSRAGTQMVWGPDGYLREIPAGMPAYEHDPAYLAVNENYSGADVPVQHQNLALWSEDCFGAAYITGGSLGRTVNAGRAPDGAWTMWSLSDPGGGAAFLKQTITVPADSTSRCCAIALAKTTGEAGHVGFFIRHQPSGGNCTIIVNTNTGQVTATAGAPSGFGVLDLGDHWLAYGAHQNSGSDTSLDCSVYPIYNDDGSTTQDGSATGTKTAGRFQVCEGTTPLPYARTAGAPVDELRYVNAAHKRVGAYMGAALTNHLLHSEDLTQWGGSGAMDVTANDSLAPDLNTSADKLDDTDASNSSFKNQSVVIPDDSSVWVLSGFVSKTTGHAHFAGLQLQLTGGSSQKFGVLSVLDTNIGVITANHSSILDSGVIEAPHHWRWWITIANNGTGNTNLDARIYPAVNSDGTTSKDSATTGANHVWGLDLKNASYPSPYIRTEGATVTQPQSKWHSDDVTWFAQGAAGAFLAEALSPYDHDSGDVIFEAAEASDFNNNRFSISHMSDLDPAAVKFIGMAAPGDDFGSKTATPLTLGAAVRSLLTYNVDDGEGYIDGVSKVTDSAMDVSDSVDKLQLGARTNGFASELDIYLQRLQYRSQRTDGAETSWLDSPHLKLDFAQPAGSHINDAVAIGPPGFLEMNRAGSAWDLDGDGELHEAAAGAACFAHDPATLEPMALLLEPASTNLNNESDDLDSWSKISGLLVTSDDAAGVWGPSTMDKLEDPATDNSAHSQKDITVADNSSPLCGSFLVRRTSADAHFLHASMELSGGTAVDANITVNTNVGSISQASANVAASDCVPYGPLCWRVWFVLENNGSGNTTLRTRIYPAFNASGGGSADVAATGSKHVGSFQVEQRAGPTSIIPTAGSTVTRPIGFARCNDPEKMGMIDKSGRGSWYAEGEWHPNEENARGTTDAYFIHLQRDNAQSAGVAFEGGQAFNHSFFHYVVTGADGIVNVAPQMVGGVVKKMGMTLDQGALRGFADGSFLAWDASMDLASPEEQAWNSLNLCSLSGGTRQSAGYLRAVEYWPQVLPDAVMEARTAA